MNIIKKGDRVQTVTDTECNRAERRRKTMKFKKGDRVEVSGEKRGADVNFLDLFAGIGGFRLGMERNAELRRGENYDLQT
ncbi:hypothetical protein BLH49_09880 [Listeria monocytogenes]|nr:hypothetical protein [Listeria monocytogenes]EAE5578570.1 hypothetical protein [Listeria monocytogenes]EAG7334566.1 hypothetical protein [Listeria monocytogenes]EAG7343674.1 hypothetical protein [Listeria monocytogenes]EAG7443129.1 hypothetical protein [Listeria monocytogenes]